METSSGLCPCGQPATETDHIWPRYWGGTDHPDNLQRLCGTCNRRKGARVDVDTADPMNLAGAILAIADRAQRDMDKVGTAALARLRGCNGGEALHLHLALCQLRLVVAAIERTPAPFKDPDDVEIVL